MVTKLTPLQVNEERNRKFEASFRQAKQLKERYFHIRPHRALSHLAFGPYLLVQVISLPLLFLYLINGMQPYILLFWSKYITFWADTLNMRLTASVQVDHTHQLQLLFTNNPQMNMPNTTVWLSTALITIVLFGTSFLLDGEKLPLKYLLRILCAVQFVALVYFWLMPGQFPYSISDHLHDLAYNGQIFTFAIPVMMAFGYYILQVSLAAKILHTLMILAFFCLTIPHQIVLHAFLLQHLSVLMMPLLYTCFSAVFNVLMFIALYSWVASTMPLPQIEPDNITIKAIA